VVFASHQKFSGNQIKEDKLDGACSTYGGREIYARLCWGNLRGKDRLEEPRVDGRLV